MAVGSISNYFVQSNYFGKTSNSFPYANRLAANSNSKTSPASAFNQALFSGLGDIRTKSAAVQSQIAAMSSLTQYSSSMGKSATYSDKNVVTASVAKNAAVSSHTKTNVTVTQLATAQQNKSVGLTATGNSFGKQFGISITDRSGKTNSFNVNLTDSDNNQSAMQAMADKINQSGIGLKATVTLDKESGTVSMSLDGTKTGETDGKFTVTDHSDAKLGNVVKDSANAQYSVNGQKFSNQTNNVKLIDGVTATLNEVGSTQITYSADTGSAVDKVKSFVNAFNDFKDSASDSAALQKQLSSLTSSFGGALSSSGIGLNSNGKLVINNEDKLKQSITDGSFAKNFQSYASIGNKLNGIAKDAYKTAYSSAVQINFSNLMKESQKSNQTGYSFWDTGLLFNGKA